MTHVQAVKVSPENFSKIQMLRKKHAKQDQKEVSGDVQMANREKEVKPLKISEHANSNISDLIAERVGTDVVENFVTDHGLGDEEKQAKVLGLKVVNGDNRCKKIKEEQCEGRELPETTTMDPQVVQPIHGNTNDHTPLCGEKYDASAEDGALWDI